MKSNSERDIFFQLGRFYIQVYVMYGLTMFDAHQTDVQVFILKFIKYKTLLLSIHYLFIIPRSKQAGLPKTVTGPADKIN
jgi:hypothetical protein